MAGLGLRDCECCGLVEVTPYPGARVRCSICRALCKFDDTPATCQVNAALARPEGSLTEMLKDALKQEEQTP